MSGVLAGFRSGRLNFIPFDYLVLLFLAVFFAAGVDAAFRLAGGDTEGIGLSLAESVILAVVSGGLLLLFLDAMRRGYVVFRQEDIDLRLPPVQPNVVYVTGKFDSFGREVQRYYEAATVRVEPSRLVLISPPGAQLMVAPASGSDGTPAMTPADPGEDYFWVELSAWRVTEVATGHLYFGFSRSPAVRFTQASARGRRRTYVAAGTVAQARWLFEWVDEARAATKPA